LVRSRASATGAFLLSKWNRKSKKQISGRLEMNRRDDDSPAEWAIPLFIVTALGVVGLLILYMGLGDLRGAWASRTWPQVHGTVVSYDVEQRQETDSRNHRYYIYTPHIVYLYHVDEQTYHGNRITFGDPGGNSPVGWRYHAEDTVNVYYSPDDPSVAVLEPGVMSTPLWVLGVGVCFAGLGVPLALAIVVRILRWLIVGRNRAAA
jgi:hypothetical protein